MVFELIMAHLKKAKALPQISATERQALEAGTTWIDGQVFSGKPDLESILSEPYSALSQRERDFVDNQVKTLCQMVDPYELSKTRVVPEQAVRYMAEQGFYSFLIPLAHEGLEFSTNAISTIMAVLSAHSPLLSTFVVIPNSLGAAELIHHYGREDQKEHYLPRLAKGEYIPCFGLTEPHAGSDAASIRATGVLSKNDSGKLEITLNFSKRYITLAPIANLVSVAFTLHDPERYLGKDEVVGITVALVHRGTKGLEMGNHHQPIGDAFYNGPIVGRDVVIDADEIIGGIEYAGQGWRMLMEQLAGGRAVSLPAGAVGGIRSAATHTGAYARIRQQFGMPIAQMEGVQEKLAELASMAYLSEGARVFALSALDAGHQPPVVSAVWKAYLTDLSRQQAANAMDVMAGAGIMQGPSNLIGRGYCSSPVAITVEGANIMTRSLITFGQGAVRCHPYAMKIANALEVDDLAQFSRYLKGWVVDLLLNTGRLLGLSVSRGYLARVPSVRGARPYLRKLAWASSRFAFLTDLALIAIGGKLKARQQLSGHFADALAWQLMAMSAIRRYKSEGELAEDLPLLQYACETALEKIQKAFEAIYANFSTGPVGWLMRGLGFFAVRLNPLVGSRKDRLVSLCAATVTSSGAQYDRLAGDLFKPEIDLDFLDANDNLAKADGLTRLCAAFEAVQQAETIERKIRTARRNRQLEKSPIEALLDQAERKAVISSSERAIYERAQRFVDQAIQVDQFTPQEFFGDKKIQSAPHFSSAVPLKNSNKKKTDAVA